jgi:hypothetical protein
VVLFFAVAPLFGATQTYNSSVASSSADWSQALGITSFDTSLGTLQQVDVLISGGMTSTLTISNQSGTLKPKASTGTANLDLTLELTIPGASTNPSFDLSTGVQNYALPANQSTNFGPFTLTGSNSQTYTLASILDLFKTTGPGNLNFDIDASAGKSLFVKGGATMIGDDTTAYANVQVVYTYSTPEPATIGLLSLGALILRKRTK